MDTIDEFRSQLRTDARTKNAFSEYLNRIRRIRWASEEEMRMDPNVMKITNATAASKREVQVKSLIRLMNRAYRGTVPTKANLIRFALALGFGDANELIATFRDLKPAERSNPHTQSSAIMSVNQVGRFVLRKGCRLNGISGRIFQIVKPITEPHSQSDSYEAIDVRRKDKVFIKTLSLSQGLTTADIEQRISRAREFLGRESLMLRKLQYVHDVARWLDYGDVYLQLKNTQQCVPFIVQSFVEGTDLEQAMKDLHPSGSGEFCGVSDPEKFLRYAQQLIHIVKAVHDQGVRHGDFQIGNIKLCPVGDDYRIKILDFGEAGLLTPDARVIRQSRHFPVTFTVAPERLRSPEKPLEVEEDIYGIGQVLYFLACGLPFKNVVNEDTDVFRDRVRREIRKRNRTLYERCPAAMVLIVQSLRANPLERASSATTLLQTLDVFQQLSGTAKPITHPRQKLKKQVKNLQEFIDEMGPDDSIFHTAIAREFTQLLERMHEMLRHQRLEFSGNREEIISFLVDFLSNLDETSSYLTTTLVGYWSRDNLGRGRFLEANRLLAKRGVKIKRLIVLQDEDLDSDPAKRAELLRVLEAHVRAITELRDEENIQTNGKTHAEDGYYCGVLPANEKRVRRLLRAGYHIGLVLKKDKAASLSFQQDAQGNVRKVFIWQLPQGNFLRDRIREIDDALSGSTPVDIYLKELKQSGETRLPD